MNAPLGRLVEVNPPVPEFMLHPEADVTFMPLDCVWPDGRADTTRRAVAATVACGYTQFRSGDILLPKITPTFEAGRACRVNLETAVGAGTTELHVLRPRLGVEGRFITYVCRSLPFLQDGAARLQGVGGLRRLPSDYVAKFPVAVVDAVLQRAIADFLDRETAQLDTLIAKQEALIATLRERRHAIVASAILDGARPLAESSGFVHLRRWFGVVLGKMLDAGRGSRTDERQLPYLRAANVQPQALDTKTINEMAFSAQEAAILDLRAGDVLVVEGGAGVGNAVVLTEDMPGWSFQKTLNRVRAKSGASPLFLTQVLRLYRDSGVLDIVCNKSTIPHLTAEKLLGLPIPNLDFDEQRRIVAHLDEQTVKIDTLIAKAERFIELAKERRAALITAAVTGQIRVPT